MFTSNCGLLNKNILITPHLCDMYLHIYVLYLGLTLSGMVCRCFCLGKNVECLRLISL